LAIYLVLIVAFVGYMALNNNRKKKAAAVQKKAIEPGVHVMTTFGLYGTVRGVDDDSVLLEIDENVLVRVSKRAVGTVVPDPSDSLDTSELDGDADHDGHNHDDHDGHNHDDHDQADHEADDDHTPALTDELADVGKDDLDVKDVEDPADAAPTTGTGSTSATATPPKNTSAKAGTDPAAPGSTGGHDDGPGPVPTR
jgi:preprotein translocase subunit YajC